MEISKSGIRLHGPAEFLGPLYAQNISTDQVCTVWLLIFEGDLFSLFSRVLHDLRKLKKYQNFDPKNADSAMAKFSS